MIYIITAFITVVLMGLMFHLDILNDIFSTKDTYYDVIEDSHSSYNKSWGDEKEKRIPKIGQLYSVIEKGWEYRGKVTDINIDEGYITILCDITFPQGVRGAAMNTHVYKRVRF
jgi:hypothetical protein